MSASSGFAGNSCLSVLFLSNLGFWFTKDAAGSEFRVFPGVEMLEFCGFHGFLSEFSAWSHELK